MSSSIASRRGAASAVVRRGGGGSRRGTRAFEAAIPFWSTWSAGLHVDGVDSLARFGSFGLNAVSADYFATMGTRILRGRGITEADTRDSPPVAVVSETMARTLWPGRDPIGACMKVNTRGGGRDPFDPGPLPYHSGEWPRTFARRICWRTRGLYYLPSAQFNPRCCSASRAHAR